MRTAANKQEGATLRDKGMAQAIGNAEAQHKDWGQKALEMLCRFPNQTFQTEELRAWAHEQGLPMPPHPRAWGPVTRKASGLGIIRLIGYQNVSNPMAHRTPAALWEKQ
jgi:hypothetical protein